jgi:hypothetical protein
MRVIEFADGFETSGAPSTSSAWTAPDGDTTSPGIAYNSDTNTGLARIGSDNFAAICGGAVACYFDTTGVRIGNNGALIGREKLTVIQSVASGNAAANNYGSWIRYSNLTNTAFSGDQIAGSFDWRRTITSDTTDTSSYPNTIFSYQVFDVASTKTYTHAAEVSNVLLGAVTNAGAGSLAIARYAALSIESSGLNTGTRKYGIKIGAQSGATNNVLISDSTSFSGSFAFYISSTNPNFFAGRTGVGSAVGSDTLFRVGGSSLTSGTEQYGAYLDTVFSSTATGGVYGITSLPQLANASFTAGYALCFSAGGVVKVGGTATLTRAVNYHGSTQTAGTNNAWASDNVSFVGNWGINLTTTRPSYIAGPMCYGSQDVASAASITGMACAASITRLTGSTATTIHGITAGQTGQIMIIRNLTGQNLTIANQSATDGTAANRIITNTGADVTTTTDSCHWFFYDGSTARWILIGGQV